MPAGVAGTTFPGWKHTLVTAQTGSWDLRVPSGSELGFCFLGPLALIGKNSYREVRDSPLYLPLSSLAIKFRVFLLPLKTQIPGWSAMQKKWMWYSGNSVSRTEPFSVHFCHGILMWSSVLKYYRLDTVFQPTISPRARVNYLILTWLEVVTIISTDTPYLSDFQFERMSLSAMIRERVDDRKNKALLIPLSLFLLAKVLRELFVYMTFTLLYLTINIKAELCQNMTEQKRVDSNNLTALKPAQSAVLCSLQYTIPWPSH